MGECVREFHASSDIFFGSIPTYGFWDSYTSSYLYLPIFLANPRKLYRCG